MSNGPINQERASHVAPRVSTPDSKRECMYAGGGRGYCGRRSGKATILVALVTCADCLAAMRADGDDRLEPQGSGS